MTTVMVSEKIIVIVRIDLLQADIGIFLPGPDFCCVSTLVDRGEKQIDFPLYRVLLLDCGNGDPTDHFQKLNKDEIVILVQASDLVQDCHHGIQEGLFDLSERYNAADVFKVSNKLLGRLYGETSLAFVLLKDDLEPFLVAK